MQIDGQICIFTFFYRSGKEIGGMTEKLSLDLILHSDVQRLLDNFASVIHAKVVLFGPDGEILRRGRSEGNSRFCQMIQHRFTIAPCLKLDREKQKESLQSGFCLSYVCHAGLREAVMPVSAGSEHLGFIVFGQFRSSDTLPACPALAFRGKQREELEQAFLELPRITPEEMDNLTSLMKMLVDYIVRCELIRRGSDFLYSAILRYMDENLTKNFSLGDMARRLGRSTSSLSHFLNARGTTFKKLLIRKRIARAEELMRDSPDMPVREAADRAGFSDPYYFSRIYRKYRGRSPVSFRKDPGGNE